jgi:diguanylate cyclase (GGDEF)-like protein
MNETNDQLLANPLFDEVRLVPMESIQPKGWFLIFDRPVEKVFLAWYDSRFRGWLRTAALLMSLFWSFRFIVNVFRVDPAMPSDVRATILLGVGLLSLSGWTMFLLLKFTKTTIHVCHFIMIPGMLGVCLTAYAMSHPALSNGDLTRVFMALFQLAVSLPLAFRLRFRMSVPFILMAIVTLIAGIGSRQGFIDGRLITQGASALAFSLTVAYLLERDARSDFLNRLTIHRLATTDALSGALRRPAFILSAQRAIVQSSGALVMIDVDHFKVINDTWGHRAGDEAIAFIGKTIAQLVPAQALFGRLGGEEFALFLPGTSVESAKVLAEKIREHIEVTEVLGTKAPFKMTASFGVSHGAHLETILHEADVALYAAKHGGRNRVELASPKTNDAAPGVLPVMIAS